MMRHLCSGGTRVKAVQKPKKPKKEKKPKKGSKGEPIASALRNTGQGACACACASLLCSGGRPLSLRTRAQCRLATRKAARRALD